VDVGAQEPVCGVDGSLPCLGTSVHPMDAGRNRSVLAINRYGWSTLCNLDPNAMGLHPRICCIAFHAHLVLPANRSDLPGGADDRDVGYLVPGSRICGGDLNESRGSCK